MTESCYGADLARQLAIVGALESYGLEVDPAAVNRRPPPARTAAEQLRRIDLGEKVVALVRRRVPVRGEDRRLIERFVDSACLRIEDQERPPRVTPHQGATAGALARYAAAGGGLFGSFEAFLRSCVTDDRLLEPAVDRQDVEPPPMTNPIRRPSPGSRPGTPAPAKSNPTRAVRSRRWNGKAARA
mgnify:CR=1 FL=1